MPPGVRDSTDFFTDWVRGRHGHAAVAVTTGPVAVGWICGGIAGLYPLPRGPAGAGRARLGQVEGAIGPWRGGGGGRGRAASLLAAAADGDPPFRSRGAGALAGIHPCPSPRSPAPTWGLVYSSCIISIGSRLGNSWPCSIRGVKVFMKFFCFFDH